MIRLVDDQWLSRILRNGQPPELDGEICTTGCWYVRLCQAVLRADGRAGRLSAPFRDLPEARRQQALRAVLALPPSIGLVSLRDLAPLMGELRQRHDLNLLGSEALAAAIHLGAPVHLSAPAPRLVAALGHEGRAVEVQPGH